MAKVGIIKVWVALLSETWQLYRKGREKTVGYHKGLEKTVKNGRNFNRQTACNYYFGII